MRKRRASVTVLLFVATLLPSTVGSAADPDPILHLSGSTKGEICLIDGNGTNRHCLTDNRRFDYDAVWSPDRARIAFVEQTNNPRNPDIYVMNADGSGKRRLTQSPRDDEVPQWSPDGTRIAWTSTHGDSINGKLKIMNADGSDKRLLVGDKGDNALPLWSPDGSSLLFMSRDACYTKACEDFQWDLHLVDPDGTNERNLTQTDEREYDPEWSPDGSRVAYVRESTRADGMDAEIWVINKDGTGARQLTDSPQGTWGPVWSPDGEMIAFTETVDEEGYEWRVGVVNVDNGEARALTDAENSGEPTWSPSGEFIAFTAFDHVPNTQTSSYDIYTIRPDGTELTRLTRTRGWESQPRWSY